MSLKKKTVKNLQFVATAQILSLGAIQLAYLLLAHMLTPDDFGIYAAILVIYNLAATLSMLGLDQATIQSKDEIESVLRTSATFRMSMAIMTAAILIVIAPLIASFFGKPEMVAPLRVMMVALIISSAGFVPTVSLSRNLRFQELSISRASSSIVWPTVAIIAALVGLAYWSFVLSFLLGAAIALAVLWYYAPWKIIFGVDWGVLKKLLSFGKYPVAISVTSFMVFNLDKIAVGRFLGANLLGIYYFTFTLGTFLPQIFTNVVNNVMFPTYSSISDDRVTLSKAYARTITYLSYLAMPIGLGLAAVSDVLVPSILGPQWSRATNPLVVLSIVGIFWALTSPAGSLFMATGNPGWAWRQTWATGAVFIMLVVPVTIFSGILGVAFLFLANAGISLVWVMKMTSRLIDVKMAGIAKSLWKPLLASSLMATAVFSAAILAPHTLTSLVGLLALGIVTYGVLVYILNRSTLMNEVRYLIGAIRSRGEDKPHNVKNSD
jgi:PST family polysaccharide transporter